MARKRRPAEEDDAWAEYLAELFQDEGVQELRTMAVTYYQYYAVCREAGFTAPQAMQLAEAMQSEFLRNAYMQNRGE
jgi:hypothetical protein